MLLRLIPSTPHATTRLPSAAGSGAALSCAVLFCATLFCAAPSRAGAEDSRPTVTLDSGALLGSREGTAVVFKGIPYAAPPVGALRWEPPARAASWSAARDAAEFGAACPQPARPNAAARVEGAGQSEDCLYLNVWAPPAANKAPVMVFIHGGGFRSGSGAIRFYDGADFARDGVVLVTFNYRLGALGIFAHPALTKAAEAHAALANYAIMDQIAVLEWVKRNIAAFGGDPANVTIFGESAGGKSVLTLMTIVKAQGLFAKAIVESGGGWEASRALADAEKQGVQIAAAAGLGADASAVQLRTLSVDQLLSLPRGLGEFGPIEDGTLITDTVTHVFAAGRQAPVPLIIGSNSDEASLMRTFNIPVEAGLAALPAPLRSAYFGSDVVIADALFTDRVMGAPARWIAAQASKRAPAYLYHFSYVPTLRRKSAHGAAHGSEIPFVFGAWPSLYQRLASSADLKMIDRVHGCWVAFAKTGKPACDDNSWAAFTPKTDTLMEFSDSCGPLANFRKTQYDALEQSLLPRILGAKP